MKSRPRGRYKKRKHDLILYLKIALIFYLTIFGVGYMSSDTSAYLSSQSEFSETVTAGIWEDPEVLINACGEEYTIDEVKADSSIEGSESEIDCGEQVGPSVGSCIDNSESVAGENRNDAVSSEGYLADCMNNGEGNDNPEEDVEIPGIDQENGDIKSEKDDENKADSDASKVDEGQKPNDETLKQPDTNDETVTEPVEMNQTDQDSPTAETLESSNE